MFTAILLLGFFSMIPTVAVVISNRMAAAKLEEVHELVNSRLTEALNKIERFERALNLRPGEEPGGRERGE